MIFLNLFDMVSSVLGEIPSGLDFLVYLFGGLFAFFVLHIIEHLFENIFISFWKG